MLHEWITAVLLRIKALLRRRELDRDLNDELEFHLAMREQRLVEQGVTPEEAHYAARREFGNPMRAKETNREMWTFTFLETLLQDLRYSLRQLRRNPGFTAVAVITLALGIGANTAIFSVVNAILLRPLPFAEPSELVSVVSTRLRGDVTDNASYPDFADWRAQNNVFSQMAAYDTDNFTLTGRGEAVHIQGAVVSANLFSLLGVKPVLGRTFLPDEDQLPAANGAFAIILSQ
ncbi:MAG: ABC transporter permease, partial [Acidobacteriota bacterium]|nr:ABC transporter permease [Acidobacteriota bacterium]